jgi:hypothetical protein
MNKNLVVARAVLRARGDTLVETITTKNHLVIVVRTKAGARARLTMAKGKRDSKKLRGWLRQDLAAADARHKRRST